MAARPDSGLTSSLLSFVIFQSEISSRLGGVGARQPVRQSAQAAGAGRGSFEEIALAAGALADRKIGALIVIERTFGLRNYVEAGVEVDSVVSSGLLVSIFTPGAPLHDGQSSFERSRVMAAACFPPLTLDRR